MNVGGGEG